MKETSQDFFPFASIRNLLQPIILGSYMFDRGFLWVCSFLLQCFLHKTRFLSPSPLVRFLIVTPPRPALSLPIISLFAFWYPFSTQANSSYLNPSIAFLISFFPPFHFHLNPFCSQIAPDCHNNYFLVRLKEMLANILKWPHSSFLVTHVTSLL